MKEAAVQKRHNLYRDSIVLSSSDPSLHLLGENPSIDWASEYGGAQEEADGDNAEDEAEAEGGESQKRRRMKQVVSMIQVEDSVVPSNESCIEVPGVNDIPEEDGGDEEKSDDKASPDQNGSASPKAPENPPVLSNGSLSKEEETKPEEQGKEVVPPKVESPTESALATEEKEKEGDIQPMVEEQPPCNQEVSDKALPPLPPSEEIPSRVTEVTPESPPEETTDVPPPPHDDSGFQSPTNEEAEEEEEGPSTGLPHPSEKHPGVMEKSVAAAPEVETTSSDAAGEQ